MKAPMIRRNTDLTDPATQELLIREPLSRVGRRRKYSREILNKGHDLAKELRSINKAAQLTGVDYTALRNWIRQKDRLANPAAYLEKRKARKTKHSAELLRALLVRATAMAEAGAPFTRACKRVVQGTGVSWRTLYHQRNSGRLPGA